MTPIYPTSEDIDDIFKKLLAASPAIKAAAIVSTEGLPIASALPQGIDESRISAMTAALFSSAKKAMIEMQKSDLQQVYIRGSKGYLLILPTGFDAVLIISTTKNARLGFIFRNFDNYYSPHPFIPPAPPGSAGSAEKRGVDDAERT